MGEIKGEHPGHSDAKEQQEQLGEGVLSREEVDGLIIEVDKSEKGQYQDGSQEVEDDE